jgi:hypothetical protein
MVRMNIYKNPKKESPHAGVLVLFALHYYFWDSYGWEWLPEKYTFSGWFTYVILNAFTLILSFGFVFLLHILLLPLFVWYIDFMARFKR